MNSSFTAVITFASHIIIITKYFAKITNFALAIHSSVFYYDVNMSARFLHNSIPYLLHGLQFYEFDMGGYLIQHNNSEASE